MANTIKHKETLFSVGDMVTVNYRIKEGTKERQQLFQGILIKITGSSAPNKSITVRKISKTGVGVEKVIPVNSPYITELTLDKKSNYNKSKLYFIRNLSRQQLRFKLFRQEK